MMPGVQHNQTSLSKTRLHLAKKKNYRIIILGCAAEARLFSGILFLLLDDSPSPCQMSLCALFPILHFLAKFLMCLSQSNAYIHPSIHARQTEA
jgi:hypothetical protein